ncbi:response regulator transcription factor [Jatrophihabitans sp.]|uniref:response regulator transcription factor n=1 Tax=Jatrophihabitans sp. TaxID=1932789 RepID=UPI0030C71180
MTEQRILVVEDDSGLRELLARGLREQGFVVTTAVDGSSALKAAAAAPVDALVLDVGLPDSDGRDVCIALRSRGVDAPVLFLTARNNLTDRLSGFAAGGDDYLGKPFAFPELVVRLRALLRRSTDPTVTWGELRLDPATHAMSRGEANVPLSPTEFRLLAKLLSMPQAVVRRRELIGSAWPDGAIVSDNTLDQYISKLRRKLTEVGADVAIEAARGLGYRLV